MPPFHDALRLGFPPVFEVSLVSCVSAVFACEKSDGTSEAVSADDAISAVMATSSRDAGAVVAAGALFRLHWRIGSHSVSSHGRDWLERHCHGHKRTCEMGRKQTFRRRCILSAAILTCMRTVPALTDITVCGK